MAELDAASTVHAAVAGDTQALRTLLEQHGPGVRNEVDGQIGERWRSLIDADDVMQVTYLETFLHISRFSGRDPGSFLGWIRRIAQNNLRDAIRELGRAKRPESGNRIGHTTEESFVALAEVLAQTSATPSRHVARAEAASVLSSTLERLPPDYRTVVTLYDLQGRSVQEVAQEMNRSAGAVHMMRARAHDRMRELLGGESRFFTTAP
jgi:RNA polymerase sigma-70 factor (ECF subfamily)